MKPRNLFGCRFTRSAILAAGIAPAVLAYTASGAAVTWDGTPVSVDTTNVLGEGLREGRIENNNFDLTTPNPVDGPDNGQGPGVSLDLRMANVFQQDGTPPYGEPDQWATNTTWVYTGQINSGANGTLSFAESIDDNVQVKIDGVTVIQDTGAGNTTQSGVLNYAPNTWHQFEIRMGNGGGGAGATPVSGFTTTYGFGFSQTGATGLNGASYEKPVEAADGTPTLFRYVVTPAGGDDVTVEDSTEVTVVGPEAEVRENSITFSPLFGQETLTVNNDAAPIQRTLASVRSTLGGADGDSITINGSANFRPGVLTDGGRTGITLTKAGGTGDLILDGVGSANDLDGVTLRVTDGRISVVGAGQNPLGTMTNAIEVSGPNAKLRFGSTSPGTIFNNAVNFSESAALEHTAGSRDVIGGAVTIATGKTVAAAITAGELTFSGAVNGGSIEKTGGGVLTFAGATNLSGLTINGGRTEVSGSLTLPSTPTLVSGTLALSGTSNNLVGPFTVGAGATLEGSVGNFGSSSNSLNLTGGTLRLVGASSGLELSIYDSDPNSPGHNAYSGILDTIEGVRAHYGSIVPSIVTLTSANGNTNLTYTPIPDSGSPFAVHGATDPDSIEALFTGKYLAASAGDYIFTTASDDGSTLYIDGTRVVANNFGQAITPRSGTVTLTPGYHDIVITYNEGVGGAGLRVEVTTPTDAAARPVANTELFTATPLGVNNPLTNIVNVQADSTIDVTGSLGATVGSLSVQPATTLTATGTTLTANTVTLNGAGTYGFSGNGTVILTTVDDNSDGSAGGSAFDVDIVKTGTGTLVLDNTTTPQLQNPGSTVNVQGGAIGLLLSNGGLSPLGQANISFNGGGLVLSSKAGPQSFQIPAFNGNGSIVARQIGSGVAGQTVTLTGSLNVGGAQTVTLGTADNYTLNVSGAASGSGNVVITGAGVEANTSTALQGLNVSLGQGGAAATLKLKSASPTIGSLAGLGGGSVVVGDGSGATVLTVNGSGNGRFNGVISEAVNSPTKLVKAGSGALTLGGANTFTNGVDVTGGILELKSGSIGTNTINLSGGTLQFIGAGLTGQYFATAPANVNNSNPNFANFATFNSHFDSLGAPAVTASTTTGGVTDFIFNLPDGDTDAPFASQGFTVADNLEARFTGSIVAPVDGLYQFSTTSDDGSVLFIDGTQVVDNNFFQGPTARSGSISLTAGVHNIQIGFYEGGVGAGVSASWTVPGGTSTLIPNSVLESSNYSGQGNVINLSGSGTFDARGAIVSLGNVNVAAGSTLTTTPGTVSFVQTVLGGAGTYNFDTAGTLISGQIVDNGNTVTINKSGVGNLVLNAPGTQLSDAGNVINVTAGNVVAVGGQSSPLGGATVNLNGGGLGLSSTVAGTETSFNNVVNVTGSASVSAGNFGGGAVDNGIVTLGSALTVASGQTLTVQSTNGYSLNFASNITGAGNLRMNSGAVNTNGTVTVNNVDVAGGTLTTAGALSANVVSVGAGAVLHTSDSLTASSVAITKGGTVDTFGNVAASGGVTVANGANLNFNGNSYTGGAIAVDGGTVSLVSGVVDLGSSLSFTPVVEQTTPNGLRARFLGTGGEFVPSLYPGNTEAGLKAALTLPAVEKTLTSALSFPNDGAFTTFFDGVNTAQRYTASFDGKITVPTTGAYTLQTGTVDDTAGFWVDLNQNGIFETSGSSGTELIASGTCCGDGPTGIANLTAGQSYRVAIAVEDTGGGGSVEARLQFPDSLDVAVVNPGDPEQAGLFSTFVSSGGGSLNIAAGAELRAATISGASDILLNGALTLNSNSAQSSTISGLRTATGGSLALNAGNDLITGSLGVSAGTTMTKSGSGTLSVGSLDVGSLVNGTPETSGRFVIAEGNVLVTGQGPTRTAANVGIVEVGAAAGLDISGTISGNVVVDTGGKLSGTGRLGDLTLQEGALMSFNLTPVNSYSPLKAVGNIVIEGNVPITLSLGFDPVDGVDQFALIRNDGANSVINGGSFVYAGNSLDDGETFIVTSGAFSQEFSIFYNAGDGNDIVLAAVPEPGTWATLASGLGMLVGLQRFRRRRLV